MGPPPFIGGNTGKREDVVKQIGLQWGRRSSSAETLGVDVIRHPGYGLQWGRRSASAETARALSILFPKIWVNDREHRPQLTRSRALDVDRKRQE